MILRKHGPEDRERLNRKMIEGMSGGKRDKMGGWLLQQVRESTKESNASSCTDELKEERYERRWRKMRVGLDLDYLLDLV